MCTRKALTPPAVAQSYLLVIHNDHDMNSKHIIIFHNVNTFKYIKNIYKYIRGTRCCFISQKIGQMGNTNVEVFLS